MAEANTKNLVLGLGGAFNPAHTQYVEVMRKARDWLNKHTHFTVVAGVLAVAPDGYVRAKAKRLGHRAMKAEHRIQLCRIACAEHQDWLGPYPRPSGSALEAAKKVKGNLKDSADVEVAVVVGADGATTKSFKAKWLTSKHNDYITVCVEMNLTLCHERD